MGTRCPARRRGRRRRRGLARVSRGGRRSGSELPLGRISRRLLAGLCFAGSVVENESRDGLNLFFQRRAENRDSPFGVLDAGVGMRNGTRRASQCDLITVQA